MRVILVVAVACALLGIWHAFLGNGEEPRATRSTQSAPPERTEPHREENEDPPPSTGDQEGRPFSVLTGLVVDTAGDPVAGATLYSLPVSAYALTGEELRTHCEETQSDDSGRFSLRGLFEDGHELVCRKGGYVPVVQSAATALRRTPVTITLHSGGRFHGRVTTVSGNPIAGATVRAREASRHLGAAEFCAGDALFYSETRTNESGFYEIRGVRPDRRYIVETYARGYAMSEHRIGSPAAWLKPTAAPVNIEMLELVVAVLGVRADGIDYTRSAATSLLLGRHIFYPEGFKRAYRGIPADRLSAPLVRRLRQLRLAGRVVVMAKRVVSSDAPLKGRVDLSLSDAPPERFEVSFAPLDRPGWDQVQWLDFGRRLGIRIGRLQVENDPPIPADVLARHPVFLRRKVWKPGQTMWVFLARPAAQERLLLVRAPPGEYLLAQAGRSTPIYEIEITAEGNDRIKTRFRDLPSLTVNPRFASGSAAREVGIHIRRLAATNGKTDWLVGIMEPLGCRLNPESIPLTEDLRGEVQVVIQKAGFKMVKFTLTLSDEDVTYEPILRRLKGY